MRRFLFACGLTALTIGGAQAVPAADAPPSGVVSPDDVAAVPDFEEPELSAARQVASSEAASLAPTTPSADVRAAGAAGHLAAVAPDVALAPAEIVSTTTVAPPTTLAPTTTTLAPTTTTTAPAVAFTATQAYGSCSEPIPYDIFSGTAAPGSTVTIASPYGSGSVVADSHGLWERTVEFPAAPRGETFAVTLSGVGDSIVLSFTAEDAGTHA